MKPDLEKTEEALVALRPCRVDPALMGRLSAAMGGEWERTPEELHSVERSLGAARPAALSGELVDRLLVTVDAVPFPGHEKVVPFPAKGTAGRSAPMSRRWLATAAAVALAGGISAWMIAPQPEGGLAKAPALKPERQPTAAAAGVDPGAFQPAAFGSDVSDTRDLGVMWSKDRRPMRVVRVVYQDRVELTNEKGEQVVMEVPRVEYLMLPEEVD